MAQSVIRTTKDYRLFEFSIDNRPVDMAEHKKLGESMRLYGFIKSFPISCFRENNRLVVRDGQHRLKFAEEYGLPVHFVEETVDYDIGLVNSTPKRWSPRHYASMYDSKGIKSYSELIDFVDSNSIPMTLSAALLAGTITFSNISEKFYSGKFVVSDRAHADLVAKMYNGLVSIRKSLRGSRLIEACVAACRVESMCLHRLLENASRASDKLTQCATRDGYLDVIECVYNYGRKSALPIKFLAQEAMRSRNVINKTK